MTVAPTSTRPEHGWYVPWVVAIVAFVLGGLMILMLYHLGVFGGSSHAAGEGSGVAASQVRHVSAFDSVELAGSNNVFIRVGEKQSVVVRADDNLLDRVTTGVRSGSLVIGNTPGSFSTKSPMSVTVTVPALEALTLSGSGNIIASGIDAKRLEASLPGNGTLTGTGRATQLEITVDGSGTVQFAQLVASDVRADVSGSGSIFVTAEKSLDASISGSGSIVYAGNPAEVTKNVTGSGGIVGT